MSKLEISIRGMHCKSCEILVEENIKEIPGVHSVQVSLKHGSATVNYSGEAPSQEELVKAVQSAGYEIGSQENIPWFSKNPHDYFRLAVAGGILVVLYLIAKSLGLFTISVGSVGSIWVAPLVGLVAGFSSCMALIGGLVLGISARHSELHPEATTAQKFKPHLFFNAGRILGYGLLGGLIGLLGSAFQFSGSVLGVVTILVGIVMVFLGLKLIEIFPALTHTTLTLPKSVSRLFGIKKETKEYSHKGALIAGALTFFLPCGFTQAMQLYAMSTGSFTEGALIMSLFALGTAPGLLGIGGLASIFKGQKARTFFMIAGLAVIILGIYNITNATRLISLPTSEVSTQEVRTNVEYQEVRMTQDGSGYSPSEFTVKAGVPVRWIITSTTQFTCASSLVMKDFNIRKTLKFGENIIEFTPTKTGTIPFSCSMGMYRGVITVE
ncbi:MAG: sulfite exporter TauE/SafE family protein [Minisyncoccia bacterium]